MVQSVTTVLTIGVERCNAFTKAVLSLQSDVPTPSPFSLRNNKTDESFTFNDPRRRHNKTDESSTFNDPKRRQI